MSSVYQGAVYPKYYELKIICYTENDYWFYFYPLTKFSLFSITITALKKIMLNKGYEKILYVTYW